MATSSWPRSRQNFYGTDRMDFSKYAADTVVQMKADDIDPVDLVGLWIG